MDQNCTFITLERSKVYLSLKENSIINNLFYI